MTHICASKLTIIGSDNGLSPRRRLEYCYLDPEEQNFSAIWIGIQTFSFKIMNLKNVVCEMASILSRHQCVKTSICTVYPKKYAHGFVVLCFVVVMQSFIMNSHEVFIHIHQGCFAGTGAIVRLPQCQWSKPDGYGKISQCITTTKHSKAKTVCIFLGIYCTWSSLLSKDWNLDMLL